MPHAITQICVVDASCVPVCPVGAIRPAPGSAGFAQAQMLYIDPVTCIDCGSCLRACPVAAIRVDDDPRTDTTAWLDLNAEYFCAAARTGADGNA